MGCKIRLNKYVNKKEQTTIHQTSYISKQNIKTFSYEDIVLNNYEISIDTVTNNCAKSQRAQWHFENPETEILGTKIFLEF